MTPMHATPIVPARQRFDGWTPDRQGAFLNFLAEGMPVEGACRMVQLSPQSAYAFRKRACGQSFDLGWRASQLHARERLAAAAYSRALDGYAETTTRPDGSVVVRHRMDNRLLMATLTRLDRLAEADCGADGAMVRHVAGRFEEYVELVEHATPSDVLAFLSQPLRQAPPPEFAALARLREAEAFLRHSDAMAAAANDPDWDDDEDDEEDAAADAIDTTDLVVADRQGWTAEQWERGAAAGLVEIRDPGEAVTNPQQPQLPAARGFGRHLPPPAADPDAEHYRYHVWSFADDPDLVVYTCYPPPEGFEGLQRGKWGEPAYWRVASLEEAAVIAAERRQDHEDLLEEALREREEAFLPPFDEDEEDAFSLSPLRGESDSPPGERREGP